MEEKTIKDPYGFIYITTNIVNGKRYIGQKKFAAKDNWKLYLGSGKRLKYAIHKYGKENFIRDIVQIAYSKEELNQFEKEWIYNLNAVDSDDYYNIGIGGEGNCFIGSKNSQYGISPSERMTTEKYEQWRNNLVNAAKRGENNKCYGMSPIDIFGENAVKYNIENARKRWTGDGNPNRINPPKKENCYWYGKHITEEIKNKSRETRCKNGTSKINMSIAKQIREEFLFGKYTQKKLAEIYNINHSTVGDILYNRIYKDNNYNCNLNNVHKLSANNKKSYRGANSKSKKVVQLSEQMEPVSIYICIVEASTKTNISYYAIRANLSRSKTYLTGGYYWMYYEDYLKLHSKEIAS